MTVTQLDGTLVQPFLHFMADLPEGDLTFIREPGLNAERVHGWVDDESLSRRWVVLEEGAVVAFLAVLRLPAWSDHVGEIRLVVHPEHRGRGLGRDLARRALLHAANEGLAKLIVEIGAHDEAHIAMFNAIGFKGEALLLDHIRDREGRLRDLVVLAHYLDDTSADMATLGLFAELAGE